jgi:hypothetical protein
VAFGLAQAAGMPHLQLRYVDLYAYSAKRQRFRRENYGQSRPKLRQKYDFVPIG